MNMFNHLPPDKLHEPAAVGPVQHGTRVARHGTVAFVRSGIARVRWDDGTTSEEWAADLEIQEDLT